MRVVEMIKILQSLPPDGILLSGNIGFTLSVYTQEKTGVCNAGMFIGMMHTPLIYVSGGKSVETSLTLEGLLSLGKKGYAWTGQNTQAGSSPD